MGWYQNRSRQTLVRPFVTPMTISNFDYSARNPVRVLNIMQIQFYCSLGRAAKFSGFYFWGSNFFLSGFARKKKKKKKPRQKNSSRYFYNISKFKYKCKPDDLLSTVLIEKTILYSYQVYASTCSKQKQSSVLRITQRVTEILFLSIDSRV